MKRYEGGWCIFTVDVMDLSGFLPVVLAGIIVIALSYALDRIWAAAMPVRWIYLLVRGPGIVLHECSHIVGCLLTGARIKNVVLFSQEGGSVTYSRPVLPYIGDVIISSAPLFLLPLALSGITWFFGTYLGCVFPVFPATIASPDTLLEIFRAILSSFPENLLARFNGWFLLYLYLAVSLVLSVAPSPQDMKNAAAGMVLVILAGLLMAWSGIPLALSLLDELLRLFGYGFTLGLVYGLVATVASLPLIIWYAYTCR